MHDLGRSSIQTARSSETEARGQAGSMHLEEPPRKPRSCSSWQGSPRGMTNYREIWEIRVQAGF